MKLRNFFKLLSEVLRNKFWRPTNGKKPFVYVALGDSTTQGVGASSHSRSFSYLVFQAIKKELRHVSYHNFGKKYSRIEHVISEQLPKALELQPDLVTISVGANDVFFKLGYKKFEIGFKQLLRELTEKTDAIIVVNNIPDFFLATRGGALLKTVGNLKAKKINHILEREAKAAGAVFVDLNSQSRLLRDYKDLISDDGIHPSDLGHAIWGAAIVSQLRPVILAKIGKVKKLAV